MSVLTSQDVQRALDRFNLGLHVQHFTVSTATSAEAAAAAHCDLGQIAKSLCFFIEGQPILVVASGDQQVDDRKLATLFNVSRKKVRMAIPELCIQVYGYAPGSVPPIGHRTPNIPTYLDQSFKRYHLIYAAAGEPNAIFPVTLDQLTTITHGQWVDIVREV